MFRQQTAAKKYVSLYKRISEYIYPILKKNPVFGPSIKKLKGGLNDVYRFKTGGARLFYKIEKKKVIVFLISMEKRNGV
ncbi:type II toxin-antitoxin system mRNA interferase toxin, RelE/StbE family [Brucepastera parasyntrophica]|uniref:type II toxin-antitoxin system RelE family toxin n=1 Tax=Brucepastera parasyntrophica TaxID=2880008 RepID=UPI00210B23CB|nr:type II toxin-antitoxin system mRNA interferase toxin, RelE/StbE family [Brucepastera parasyntrophica]ULQ58577.1 type II toxin-antitoxin system mRNA interferase toxin, RelE/StbE family [Brucepastera parasyntrophica]